MPFDSLGKTLLVVGLVIAVVGVGIMLAGRVPFLGNLPGDISYERDGVRVSFPIVTSILVSIVLTIVLNVVFGILGRR
jgi:hypothetical protein